MSDRKPFIVVHQENVEEFDSLDDALVGIKETREFYHQGGYGVYDFEGGIYQIIKEDYTPEVKLPNQSEYEQRYDHELKPFAVVDKSDNSELIGTGINIFGKDVVLTEDNLPQLEYHGFDNLDKARTEFGKRKDNETGLYSVVVFQKVLGPDRKK